MSVGPAIAGAAMARIRDAARELLTAGTYSALANGVPFAEANVRWRFHFRDGLVDEVGWEPRAGD